MDHEGRCGSGEVDLRGRGGEDVRPWLPSEEGSGLQRLAHGEAMAKGG